MYQITIDNSKKEFMAKVGGFFDEKEGQSFVKDYVAKAETINPSNFKLIVESTDLAATLPKDLVNLENSIKFYMMHGFKEIFIVNPKSPTARVQLRKVCQSVNFTGKLVNTLEETK